MKKIYSIITILAFSWLSSVASPANDTDNTNDNNTYYINAPRFVRPLIEKWIAEYKKEVPSANFAIAKTPAAKSNSTLSIQLYDAHQKDINHATTFFGAYAILPFAARNTAVAKELESLHLSAKKLKALYFENEDIDEAEQKSKFAHVNIYSGNSKESVSAVFAAHYGKEASNFRGKRIVGDDLFLVAATTKDPQGVSLNALTNLYDLNTRKVKEGIAILSLDYNKEEKAALSEGNTIDALLDVLEAGKDSQIPTSRIGFVYQPGDAAATRFLTWILTTGQQYNHQYGIMRLDSKLLAEQVKSLPNRLTAQK